MLISGYFCADLVSTLLALIILLYGYFKWSFNYWHKKHLPYLDPQIPFGNVALSTTGKEHMSVTIRRIYNDMKAKKWKHGGIYIFTSPAYIPINLDYIKNILTKDFLHFTDRPAYYNEKEDPLEAHLVHVGGEKWHILRDKLRFAFTPSKIRLMFQTIANCQSGLLKKMNAECEKKNAINIKEVVTRFTTDIIGTCGFGLDFDAFEKNSLFCKYGKILFDISKFERLKLIFSATFPRLALYLNVSTCPKEINEFFMKLVKDVVSYRAKNNYRRDDFVQLLIEMKDEGKLTIEEVAAQCFVFFIAGFEPPSNAMTFVLYALGRNPSVQDKVRDEINSVLEKHGGKISYDSIQDLKYLDQVIDETLRMYPPVPQVGRRCVKDYKIPGENVTIEKGTRVIIPILAIHYDPEYYPDPEKFDPERFNEKNSSMRYNYAHIPFGEGPRYCIGKRLGLLQVKIGLSCLLKNFKFTVNSKTQEPLQFQTSPVVLSVVDDIWLNAEKV